MRLSDPLTRAGYLQKWRWNSQVLITWGGWSMPLDVSDEAEEVDMDPLSMLEFLVAEE